MMIYGAALPWRDWGRRVALIVALLVVLLLTGGIGKPMVCISAAAASPVLPTESAESSSAAAASPAQSPPEPFLEPPLGQVESFWAVNWRTEATVRLSAYLAHIGEHCMIYVENNKTVFPQKVSALARAFDENIYPNLTTVLGPEPNPGIDGNPKMVILLYDFRDPAIVGSFYGGDLEPDDHTDSNRREMIYLDVTAAMLDTDRIAAAAAHEFAHLIVYYRDFMLDDPRRRTREAVWLEEGLAMYAQLVAGYGESTDLELFSFSRQPNKNLTRWRGGFLSDYGSSYAFVAYLAERLGRPFVRVLVDEPRDGITGIEAALTTVGSSLTFDQVFDDWVLANFLDGRMHANDLPELGLYCYEALSIAAQDQATQAPLPHVGRLSVQNYAARYIELPRMDITRSVRAVVDGEDHAPLLAALVSWDPASEYDELPPARVLPLFMNSLTTGGWAESGDGYHRHALVVWSRGVEGADEQYSFAYSLAVDQTTPVQFLDVGSDHLFYVFIADLLERGVISGAQVPSGSGLWYFRPEAPVLRAQFAKMAVEVADLHTAEIELTGFRCFPDVPLNVEDGSDPASYPFDYVHEAAAAGIVLGGSDGLFRPWDPVTRIQLVRMIIRAAAAAGRPLTPYTGGEAVFADVTPAGPHYVDVMTAYAAGIISGSVDGDGRRYFSPWESANRGQVAKMTSNLVGVLTTAN